MQACHPSANPCNARAKSEDGKKKKKALQACPTLWGVTEASTEGSIKKKNGLAQL
jgi:hypothetical protein